MLKMALVTVITLASFSSFARNKEVMGILARCDCHENTIDGQKYLGKVNNKLATRTEATARAQAFGACQNDVDVKENAVVSNCQYIKAVDEKVGQVVKRRIEKIKDDEENNLHNDLLGTL